MQFVRYYVRWRWLRYKISLVPLPLKLGGAQSLTMFVIVGLMPLELHRPALALPVLWAASLCVGFIAAALLPRRRRSGA